MFKSELPPSYEESQPQGGSSPPPPHTYTTPEMPEAGTGAEAGAGVPPPGTSTVILPTYTSLGDIDASDPSALWENKSIRHAFIRKVYLILALQLLVTTSIVAVFTFVPSLRLFIIQNPVVYWLSFVVFLVTYIVLVCSENMRRRFPGNLILLFIFTLAMSFMAGTTSSYYETKAVFLALGITMLVCVAVTVFSFQTKVDFTSRPGLFCVLCIVLLITGIITAIVLSLQYVRWLHMLYASIGAIVFTLFLAYDTQLLLGNRTYSLNPEDYVFGALSLYTDIIQIFLFLLQIISDD